MTGKKDSEHSTILEEREDLRKQNTCIGKLLERSSEKLHNNNCHKRKLYRPDILVPTSFTGAVGLDYRFSWREKAAEKFNKYSSEHFETVIYMQEIVGNF